MGEHFTEERTELFVHYNITLKKSQFLTAIYSSPHIAKNISQHDKTKASNLLENIFLDIICSLKLKGFLLSGFKNPVPFLEQKVSLVKHPKACTFPNYLETTVYYFCKIMLNIFDDKFRRYSKFSTGLGRIFHF